ncbi:unnamed protein product [Caenorhabditis sp. 36 PRJEB53466]|nr:unnamed protein product [Caenorhabditis sp. 36 PRJEB53466]
MNSLLILSLLCVAVSAHILPPLDICLSREDCPFPQICFGGKCVFKDPLVSRTFYAHVGQASERPSFGKECNTSEDCDNGSSCQDGECEVMNGLGGACFSDAFCPDGYICVSGKCQVFKLRHFAPPRFCSNDRQCPPKTICVNNAVCMAV